MAEENVLTTPETPPEGPPPAAPPEGENTPPQPPPGEAAAGAENTPPEQKPPEPPTDETDKGQSARVVPAADGYKLPEGAPAELGAWANANNLTQDQLDASVKKMGEVAALSKQAEKFATRAAGEAHVKNWGEKRQYNTGIIKRALPQIDPNGSLTKMLNESGLINHPAVLDALLSVGESMKEGGFLRGVNTRPPGQRTAAQAMYPNFPSKG